MSVSYLHGIERVTGSNAAANIQTVKTAVRCIVGIAPQGPANELTLVNSKSDAAQFGSPLPGFDLPQALSIMLGFGAGPILVVNVFNSTTNTTQVTNESQTVTAGKLKLAFAPIGAVTVNDSNGDPVAFVAGTDYSIDAYGNFQVLSSAITNTTVLKFTYKKLNGASVTSSQVIGTYNTGTGARTGMQCWDLAKTTFGWTPKILLAPNYSSVNAVSAELIVKAEKYKAICYLDAPSGTTVTGAITGRALSSTINFINTNKRAELLYPYQNCYDVATDSTQPFPYSAFLAGLRAKVDNDEGYWVSTSNHDLLGSLGASVKMTQAFNDPDADNQLLNAIGITTNFGLKAWGNRNASYPSNTQPDNFVTDVRTADIIFESIIEGLLPYVDKPITKALIDVILESANSFVRTLIGRGALVPGTEVIFPAEFNTPTEMAAGHLTFELVRMVTPPLERISLRDTIDINLLKNLVV
jgi:uncharacterized protein